MRLTWRSVRFWAWVSLWVSLGVNAPGPVQAEAARPSPRLISLAPNLTELIYALGLEAHLVGRSSACDYPDAVSTVPIVGGFGRPNWERLIALQPDVVVATDLEKAGLVDQMRRYGMEAVLLPCESWTDLRHAARTIAAAAGQAERGERWVRKLDLALQAIRDEVVACMGDDERPAVYVEVWGQPIMTAGGDTFLNALIELAGGRNIAYSLDDHYQSVSSEWVIEQNPDVILLAYMRAREQAGDILRERLGWSGIPAVKDNRIVDDIPPDWLLRPGPRLVQGARALARRLCAMQRTTSMARRGDQRPRGAAPGARAGGAALTSREPSDSPHRVQR